MMEVLLQSPIHDAIEQYFEQYPILAWIVAILLTVKLIDFVVEEFEEWHAGLNGERMSNESPREWVERAADTGRRFEEAEAPNVYYDTQSGDYYALSDDEDDETVYVLENDDLQAEWGVKEEIR